MMRRRCNKLETEATAHVGPVPYHEALPSGSGTTVVGTCAHCGNTVILRLHPGEPVPPLEPQRFIYDPPQKY
jgi:hypothetical protein